jgi:poly-D-alanine transfer protein DltD
MNLCNYNHNIINLIANRTPDKKIEENIDYVVDPQYNNFVLVPNFTVGSENSGILFVLIPSQKTYNPYTSYAAEGYPEKNIIRYGLYFRYENMKLEFGEGRK